MVQDGSGNDSPSCALRVRYISLLSEIHVHGWPREVVNSVTFSVWDHADSKLSVQKRKQTWTDNELHLV